MCKDTADQRSKSKLTQAKMLYNRKEALKHDQNRCIQFCVRYVKSLEICANHALLFLFATMIFSFASNLMYMYDEATGSLMALTVYIFTYNWYILYGSALTRERRAFLSVSNVLDTYQYVTFCCFREKTKFY